MATGGSDCNKKKIELPPGHKFCPWDEELIHHYLIKNILDQPIPDLIPTIDVYSFPAPETLPYGLFRYGRPSEWYFFATRPKHKGNILTSEGHWNRISKENEKIMEDGKAIGFWRKLQFVYEGPTKEIKNDWFIVEYRVNPIMFGNLEELDDATKEKILTMVVCQVTTEKPEESKEMKRKNQSKEDKLRKKMKI